jgi:hypothetical protein
MKGFVHPGDVPRPKRAIDNERHIACEKVDGVESPAVASHPLRVLRPMAGETAAGARKFGGKAASVYQRVEDNAFHLSL